jgi:thiol-disulfide isomerase/thioredoxin
MNPIAVLAFSILCWASAFAGDLAPQATRQPLELSLRDLDGRDRSLRELHGQVVLLSFWASWCPPCIQEMPGIQRLADGMRGKPFAVIGVNVAEDQSRVKSLVRRMGVGFPILLDRDGAVFNRWGTTVLPTNLLLDRRGAVRYVGRGPLDWDAPEIADALEALIAEGDAATGTPADRPPAAD